ncbi:ogr/Delta-like zinc finger family protein [Aeromonas sp. s5]
MRVICSVCGAFGRITKTNRLSHNVADLYCQCTEPACSHTWVSSLSFSHTLTPSRKTMGDIAMSSIFGLSLEQKENLAKELNQHLVSLRQENQRQAEKPTYQRR